MTEERWHFGTIALDYSPQHVYTQQLQAYMETGYKLLVESSTAANSTIAFQHLSYAQKLQAYVDSPCIHWT